MRLTLSVLLIPFVAGCSLSGDSRFEQPRIRLQVVDTDASLRGVAAISTEVAWASGFGGTVCRTLDGGETWQVLHVPGGEELDLRALVAFDADTALFASAGTPARIYRTGDGGRTFDLVHEAQEPGVFFSSLVFADDRRGYAFSDPVGGRFLVMRSTDAGLSWRRLPSESAMPLPLDGEAGFAASNTMLCTYGTQHLWIGTGGGDVARVLSSTDAGRTWQIAEVPVGWPAGAGERANSAGVFSIAFWDERNGVAVGGDYRRQSRVTGTAARTLDGGVTWQPSISVPSGYRSCVAIPSGMSATALAVGTNGMDATTDGGATWSPVSTLGFHALAFEPHGRVGWAVGSAGRIARVDLVEPSGSAEGSR